MKLAPPHDRFRRAAADDDRRSKKKSGTFAQLLPLRKVMATPPKPQTLGGPSAASLANPSLVDPLKPD